MAAHSLSVEFEAFSLLQRYIFIMLKERTGLRDIDTKGSLKRSKVSFTG